MEYIPEIEVFSAKAEAHDLADGGFAPVIAPADGHFSLVVILSGMVRGEVRLPDGRIPFKSSGNGAESAILIVPPGGVFEASLVTGQTEAFAFDFACPLLVPQRSMLRLELKCPDGSRVRLFFAASLSNYDVAILRPTAWRAYKDISADPSSGRRLRGVIHFMAILSQMFVEPRNMEYWGNPAVVLQKSIEANPRGSTVRGLARRLKCSAGTLRRRFNERSPGLSPSEYRVEQTLHMMRYYILDTRLPFKTVARQIGFKSASYFTRYCVRHLGATPRKIRALGRFPDPS